MSLELVPNVPLAKNSVLIIGDSFGKPHKIRHIIHLMGDHSNIHQLSISTRTWNLALQDFGSKYNLMEADSDTCMPIRT